MAIYPVYPGGRGGGGDTGPFTSIRVKRGTSQTIPQNVATTYVYNERGIERASAAAAKKDKNNNGATCKWYSA